MGRVAGNRSLTGALKWEWKHPSPTWSGVLSTEGGLVFTGDAEGNFLSLIHIYYSVKLGIANAAVGLYPEVLVWRQGHEGPGYSLGYNPRDEAIEGLLPNGNYTVQVTSRGTAAMMGTSNITVSGAPISGAVVTLVPGTAIAVSVREQLQHSQTNSTSTVTDGFRPNVAAVSYTHLVRHVVRVVLVEVHGALHVRQRSAGRCV